MKTIKTKFTRDSKLICKRVYKDEVISTIMYENGKCEIHSGGFQHTIYNIDELVMTMRPLDEFITEITFVAENNLGTKNKLDLKIIGILNEHILMECENEEREDSPKNPGVRSRKSETLIKTTSIPG